jgi:hypothetical protein
VAPLGAPADQFAAPVAPVSSPTALLSAAASFPAPSAVPVVPAGHPSVSAVSSAAPTVPSGHSFVPAAPSAAPIVFAGSSVASAAFPAAPVVAPVPSFIPAAAFSATSAAFALSSAPAVPSFAAPAAPVPSFAAPAAPVPLFAAPAAPVPVFAAPAAPVPLFAAPAVPVSSFTAPAASVSSFAAPAAPVSSFAAPAAPHSLSASYPFTAVAAPGPPAVSSAAIAAVTAPSSPPAYVPSGVFQQSFSAAPVSPQAPANLAARFLPPFQPQELFSAGAQARGQSDATPAPHPPEFTPPPFVRRSAAGGGGAAMPPPAKVAAVLAPGAASAAPTVARVFTEPLPPTPGMPFSPMPSYQTPSGPLVPADGFYPFTPTPPFTHLAGSVHHAATPHRMDGAIMPQVGASATQAVGSAYMGASNTCPVSPVSTVSSFPSVSSASFPFSSVSSSSVFPPPPTPFSSVSSCFPSASQTSLPVPSVPLCFPPFSRDSHFVNFQNFVGSTRELPVEVPDSPASGTAARPINLDTPPARVQFSEPAPSSPSRWKGTLFQRLIHGLRHHRTALQQLPPQSSEPLRDPISYRTHEDVSQLALDWAVSVEDDPSVLEECLLSIARLTGYDPPSLHQDLSRSGNVAFTIISAFAAAICAGSPARSFFYARQCLDILEGDILYQTNMNKQETERSRSRDSPDDSSEESSSGSDSMDSDSSSTSDSSSSSSSHLRKRKSKIKSKGASPPSSQVPSPASNPTDQLLAALLTRQNHASLVATPPASWTAGDAPKGGYYLETFVRVYRDYKRFIRVYGSNTSVTFKSLIGDDIEPQVRADCKLSETRYQKTSDDELLKLLKERLSFKEKDYYISQLEDLRLPPHPVTSLKLYSAFTKLSTDMLRIEDEAKQNGVKLNKHGLKNLFSKLVKDYYRLQSWFNAKKFRSLSSSVRYINGKIKKRMVEEKSGIMTTAWTKQLCMECDMITEAVNRKRPTLRLLAGGEADVAEAVEMFAAESKRVTGFSPNRKLHSLRLIKQP